MKRCVWFQLVDASSRLPFRSTSVDAVELTEDANVSRFCSAVKDRYNDSHLEGIAPSDLKIFANPAAYAAKKNLTKLSTALTGLGMDEDSPLIVEVPKPRTDVVAAPFALPNITVLNDPDKFAEECTAFQEWEVGVVHEIPSIWEFMKPLGGCTTKGNVFWREEDKQVASILVDGWFRESTPDNINIHTNKQSILMGSPGMGKSTLLCVMAFYLVLVYRRLTGQSNCLLYLTYSAGQVLYFSIPLCEEPHAVSIYKDLIRHHGLADIWLLLDGFQYEQIPQSLATFSLLATSQQVDLTSQELDGAYCCLLPSWRKEDLFTLGEQVYNFEEEGMDDRFYLSGGSVQEFTRATLEDIQTSISRACSRVADASHLFSLLDRSGVVELRQTFVQDVHVLPSIIFLLSTGNKWLIQNLPSCTFPGICGRRICFFSIIGREVLAMTHRWLRVRDLSASLGCQQQFELAHVGI